MPRPLQRALWAAYQPGQERRLDPSPSYLLAAARCVHAVATLEGQPPGEIASEIQLYEAWSNALTDEPRDFTALLAT